jgi:nitrite reductase/ring-hydroxylating ferredoxin subunit
VTVAEHGVRLEGDEPNGLAQMIAGLVEANAAADAGRARLLATTRATLGTTRLLLVRRGDMVNALLETCSHLGGPLSKGTLEGDGIVCPWHFSKFRLSDGAVLHGPAGSRLPTFSARIRAGQVEVQGPRD